MPIYEYKCTKCGEVTAELRSMSERESPLACPRCGAPAEVILSTFATSSGESRPDCFGSAPDCGST